MHSGHIIVIYALINVFHEGGEGGEKDENGMMARGNISPGGVGGGVWYINNFFVDRGAKEGNVRKCETPKRKKR